MSTIAVTTVTTANGTTNQVHNTGNSAGPSITLAAATPSITFNSNSSTTAAYVDSSGNLGVGTTSPTSKFTVTSGISEIRDGNYFMMRPSGNNWDMRLQATGNQLNILSGGALSSPIASFLHGGYVTKPSNPAFHMTGTTTGISITADQVLPFNTSIFNIGGYYNTSTYRFTAPVAGTYFFYASYLTYPGNDTSWYTTVFTVNGSAAYNYGMVRGGLTGQTTRNISSTIYLNAGDYVQVYIALQGGQTAYYYDAGGHGHFFGYLIG